MKLFGLDKCTTCRKARDWLDAKKLRYSFTDYRATPIAEAQVALWSTALGGWDKMINRSGYTWRGLPPEQTENLTEARAVKLAVANPSLIRRPVIEHKDGTVTVGFSEKVKSRLG